MAMHTSKIAKVASNGIYIYIYIYIYIFIYIYIQTWA